MYWFIKYNCSQKITNILKKLKVQDYNMDIVTENTIKVVFSFSNLS